MNDRITLDTVIVRRNDMLTADLSERETVLLHLERGNYYGMEHVARDVWELLASPCQVSALCDRLLSKFDVDPQTCRHDVLRYLQELLDDDLIDILAESADTPAAKLMDR